MSFTYAGSPNHQARPRICISKFSTLSSASSTSGSAPNIDFSCGRRDGVPLTYFCPHAGRQDMSNTIDDAGKIVFGDNAHSIVLHILCPGYESVRDYGCTVDSRNMTRARLGQYVAEIYKVFFTTTLNERFPPSGPSLLGTGPFGERIEHFNLVSVRNLFGEFWQVKIIRNGNP